MRIFYEAFRGTWTSWDELFRQASKFGSRIGAERLISISHSEDHNEGVVTVWYWSDAKLEVEPEIAYGDWRCDSCGKTTPVKYDRCRKCNAVRPGLKKLPDEAPIEPA